MTLQDIPIGGRFRLSPKGIVYEKLNEQGMENAASYIRNLIPARCRKSKSGYRERLYLQTKTVYPE